MKTSTRIFLTSAMSLLLALPATSYGQMRGSGARSAPSSARPSVSRQATTRPAANTTTRSTSTQTSRPALNTNTRSSGVSTSQPVQNTTSKPATNTRVSRPASSQPAVNTQTRPNVTTSRPSASTQASGLAPTPVRPSAGNGSKPATQTRPTVTSPTRPSTSTQAKPTAPSDVKPAGNTPSRPSSPSTPPATPPSSNQNTSKPTGPTTQRPSTPPASNQNPSRPSGPATQKPSTPPNTQRPGAVTRPNTPPPAVNRPSAVKPGPTAGRNPAPAYRPGVVRPNNNYIRPNYRPPRPNGGFWSPPPASIFRPAWFRPLPPPRPVYVNYGIPTIGNILGLAFGTFIDAGINSLFNAGYNVLGYADNIVYLSNVNQLGYSWPEVSIYYTDGLMSNAQFQYWTSYSSQARFDSVYSLLTSTYGYPAETTVSNGVTYVSWWAGGDTGYITLSYGPGLGSNGRSYYYTTLTYSDYY